MAALLLYPQLNLADPQSPEQQKLEQIKQQIQSLTDQIQNEQKQRDTDVTLLKETDESISVQSAQLVEAEKKISAVIQRTEELEQRLKPLQQRLSSQRGYLARQVSATWRMGRQQYLKLLLNQDEPERFSRMLTYYNYLNAARVEVINDIKSSYREILEIDRALVAERQQHEKYLDEQKGILKSLEAARSEQKQIVEHWTASIGSSEKQLERLSEDAESLNKLIRQIDKAIPQEFRQIGESSFQQLKGKLVWPVKGRLAKRFGERQSGGVKLEGVVIKLAEGEPVRSVHGGTVVFSDWLRGYGMMLIVEHDHGYMSLYGYNQRLLKAVGDEVEAGEIISLSGSSGGQKSASLYFAIRKGAQSMNPTRWCRVPSKGKVG